MDEPVTCKACGSDWDVQWQAVLMAEDHLITELLCNWCRAMVRQVVDGERV